MYRKILFFSLTFFSQSHLLAQEILIQDSTVNNGWQITLSPTLSSKERIKANYLNTSELNVYSKNTLGIDFQVFRNYSINEHSFFSVGGSLGTYKADIGYNLSEKLLDSLKLKSFDANYYDNYGLAFLLSASTKYYFKILKNNRTYLYANVGLGINYLSPAFYNFGNNTNHLSLNGSFNENRKPFLSGIVGLSFRRQISDRLYFISGLNYAYSSSVTFKGNYEIYTKSNTVSGTVEKKFSILNVDLGFFRSFSAIPFTSPKVKKNKKDVEILDFQGKGWGLSLTPYFVPKFTINQNPVSQTTTVFSKPRLSYKAELSNLTPLSKKAFLKTRLVRVRR